MSIQIEIEPGLTVDDINIKWTGDDRTDVTADILNSGWPLKSFGLGDQYALREGVFLWLGRNGYHAECIPNFAWLNDPSQPAYMLSGAGGGYPTHQDVGLIRLRPIAGYVEKITEEVTLIDHAIWDNQGVKTPTEYKASLDTSVETSVSSEWSQSTTVGESTEIGVSVGPAEGKESVSYETSYGHSHSETHSTTVTTGNEIAREVPAGALEVAAITAQRGTLTVHVEYAYEILSGDVLVHTRGNRGGTHTGCTVTVTTPNGSRYPASWLLLPLRELAAAWGLNPAVHNTQQFTIDLYADASLGAYPIPDKSQASIEKAVGAHGPKTIYQRPTK